MTYSIDREVCQILESFYDEGIRYKSDRTKDGLARAVKQGKKLGRPKVTLSPYQKDKIREIKRQDPDIKPYILAKQFTGISPDTLVKLARAEGLI